MRTHQIALIAFTLLSYSASFAQALEVFCEPVTISIDDPFVTVDVDAKDLISGIQGGTAPFSYAFYTPGGPEYISLSCLSQGTIEVEVNVIDANLQVSSCLGIIHVELSNLLPAAELCNSTLASALDEKGEYVLIKHHLPLENYCGIQDISFGKTHFNCSDLSIPGTFNPVSIVVTLVDGSTFTCTLRLVIFDQYGPTITCPANIHLQLPLTGSLTVSPQLLGISAQATCEIPTITLSKTVFSCSDIGQTTVIATATTIDGDVGLCPVDVTLSDPLKACAPQAYCHCQGENSEVFINAVQFASIRNSSGDDGGYGDFTTLQADVEVGEKYLFSLSTIALNQQRRNVFANIWIDWDRNGIFERNELVMHKKQKANEGRSWIRIPRKAMAGATRMRVIAGLAAPPNPCRNIAVGEVEDYTLIISPPVMNARSFETQQNPKPLFIPESAFSEELSVSSSPANNQVLIKVPESMPTGIIYLLNVHGQVIQRFPYSLPDESRQSIDVTAFVPGIYFVTVSTAKHRITKSVLLIQ